MWHDVFQTIGLIAGIILPFFNVPLIVRIVQRKSSKDISLFWAVGVWVCIMLMAPRAFTSEDIVWRIFSYINTFLFTLVAITVLRYRRQKA